jgi:hypothetical protein
VKRCAPVDPAGAAALRLRFSFRQHLEGRIAFVESVNRARGDRLRAVFGQIRW